MYTENEALNILLSSKASMKPVFIDGKAIVRLFDQDDNMIHETKGDGADQSALKWLVDHKGAKSRVIGDDEAKDNRLTEVEQQLAATNERLAAIVAASQPATPAEEKPAARRGRRAAEPDPALTDENA